MWRRRIVRAIRIGNERKASGAWFERGPPTLESVGREKSRFTNVDGEIVAVMQQRAQTSLPIDCNSSDLSTIITLLVFAMYHCQSLAFHTPFRPFFSVNEYLIIVLYKYDDARNVSPPIISHNGLCTRSATGRSSSSTCVYPL